MARQGHGGWIPPYDLPDCHLIGSAAVAEVTTSLVIIRTDPEVCPTSSPPATI